VTCTISSNDSNVNTARELDPGLFVCYCRFTCIIYLYGITAHWLSVALASSLCNAVGMHRAYGERPLLRCNVWEKPALLEDILLEVDVPSVICHTWYCSKLVESAHK